MKRFLLDGFVKIDDFHSLKIGMFCCTFILRTNSYIGNILASYPLQSFIVVKSKQNIRPNIVVVTDLSVDVVAALHASCAQ